MDNAGHRYVYMYVSPWLCRRGLHDYSLHPESVKNVVKPEEIRRATDTSDSPAQARREI